MTNSSETDAHQRRAEGFPPSAPLVSGAMPLKPNLSDGKVKEHLVNHFPVCQKNLLTLCLGLMPLNIPDNPPTVGPARLGSAQALRTDLINSQ